MTERALVSPHCALVLIDLQHGITALPTISPSEQIVTAAAELAGAFRTAGRPVVLVNTNFAPDRADALTPEIDAPPLPVRPSPDFATLRPELGATPSDIRITKHQWDAFHGTELDLQLRRRHVDQIVLAGISTSIGVESTARQAFSLGYNLLLVTDAMTDTVASAHANSIDTIFPRLGRRVSTEAVLVGLEALSSVD